MATMGKHVAEAILLFGDAYLVSKSCKKKRVKQKEVMTNEKSKAKRKSNYATAMQSSLLVNIMNQ